MGKDADVSMLTRHSHRLSALEALPWWWRATPCQQFWPRQSDYLLDFYREGFPMRAPRPTCMDRDIRVTTLMGQNPVLDIIAATDANQCRCAIVSIGNRLLLPRREQLWRLPLYETLWKTSVFNVAGFRANLPRGWRGEVDWECATSTATHADG
eukprot:1554664-Pyramimonas_sp.AAC.1